MAFSLDVDIYTWLLEDVLKVSPSGDPVNDAVYLILLPMVVLYMYSDFVISKSRFMGSHGKLKYIMMFIVGFVIVREGYYAFFASMSLPLLGLIMVWHAFSFVMGWGQRSGSKNAGEDYKVGWRSGGGGRRGEVAEEKKSTLASIAEFVEDVKNPRKLVQKDFYVKLGRDIRNLKTNIDENIETFASMASSREGNKNAAEIVTKLRSLRQELAEIERKINDGEEIGTVEIEDFRNRLQRILDEESKAA